MAAMSSIHVLTVAGYRFTYRTEKYSDCLIATCNEIPTINTFGQSEKGVEDELKKAIKGYMKAFPDKLTHSKITKLAA